MTARYGIAPIRRHSRGVMRLGVVSQPAAAPAHPYTVRCSAELSALCPACGDALAVRGWNREQAVKSALRRAGVPS